MAMYRLRPGFGSHVEAGVSVDAGEVIETDVNLVALFPDKFEEVVLAEDEDDEDE